MMLGRRMQYCPVCEKQTRHRYRGANPLLLVFLLCLGIVPGLLYLMIAAGKAKRTAECMNDHAAIRAERKAEEMRALVAAMREAGETPAEPARKGAGWLKRVA
jgi:hypothetical protein